MIREDGRTEKALRPVKLTRQAVKYPEGSVLIEIGDTHVLCNATVEEKVPPHRKGSGLGWVTAEYAMLPRSTTQRTPRESVSGKQKGRTQEIQRLIGRALRSVVDMSLLGERTIVLDCDVLQADGGTRTAAITGAYVALHDAISYLRKEGGLRSPASPLGEFLAAVSVGMVRGVPLLDLKYSEDAYAEVDMNVVMTESGKLVEVQATAEEKPFDQEMLQRLLGLAEEGIGQLIVKQREALNIVKKG